MAGIPFLLAKVTLASLTVASLTLIAQDQQPATPQTPAANGGKAETARPDPINRTVRPLTPQEERERAIRLYDPLSRTSPHSPGEREPQDIPADGTASEKNQGRTGSVSGALSGTGASSGARNPMSAGPRIANDNSAESASQDYSGPAVLSRGYSLSSPSDSRTIRWVPILGVSSIYNTGLAAFPTVQTGTTSTQSQPLNQSSFGTQLSWGLSGSHLGKRYKIGLGYFGSANRYYGVGAYNGANHSLSLDYSRIITQHFILNVSQSLSSTTQSYSLENQLSSGIDVAPTTNLAITPTVGVLDQGTRQSSSSLGGTWQQTSRTTFSFNGGVFFVERGGAGFSGTTGYQAQGSVNHRFSRKLSLGTYYSYSTYVFTKHISVSDSNTFGGSISYAFDRATVIHLKLGTSSVESQGLTVVRLDPIIAQILGQSSGIVVSYQKSRVQDIAMDFSRDLGRRRSIRASYAKGVAPGNGIIQTSTREAINGNFSMTLFRSYQIGLNVVNDKLSSIDSSIPVYSTRGGQFSISRKLSQTLASNFTVDYRRISGLVNGGTTGQLRITTGVNWGRNDGKLW